MTVLQAQPLVPMEDEADMNNHDEYELLMSLALDKLLDKAEQTQLESHLTDCAHCRNQWTLWQSIDAAFRAAPLMAPSPAFVHSFGKQLAVQERRRQLRLGILLGVLTFVMWLIGVTGVVLVIGALVYNQFGWLAESVHWLAYVWTAVSVIGRSGLELLGGLSEQPSAIGILAGYVMLAGAILIVWFRYLRRSLQSEEVYSL